MDDAEKPPEAATTIIEPWSFPPDLLARWVALPDDLPLTSPVTRGMLDNLFFALSKLAMAMSDIDVALVAYSNGELDAANERLLAGRKNNVEALSHARLMLAGFMQGAAVAPDE